MMTRDSVVHTAGVSDVNDAREVIFAMLREASKLNHQSPLDPNAYPPETYDYIEVLLSLKSAEILSLEAMQKHGFFSTLRAMFAGRDILDKREIIEIERSVAHANRILEDLTMRDASGRPLDTEEDFMHVSLLAEEAALYSFHSMSLLMSAYLERDRNVRRALLVDIVDKLRIAEARMKTLARPTCGDLIEIIEIRVS